jgi:hypothetical protein
MKVSDPAGNVITVDPPLNLGDGSANAPTGTPQMPNLLSGYAVRPSWNVAGVDYAVGIQSGITLQDPLTGALPAGVTRDATNHIFTISGNNVVLSGWNFSLEGGWGVQVVGNNDTIENNYFKIGANAVDPINSGGSDINTVTILNNVIDGSGIKPSLNVGLIWLLDQGTSTIEYNLIENAYTTAIQESITGSNGSASQVGQIIQYNVIANTGLGYTVDGSHGDFVQDFGIAQPGSTQVFKNIQVNYNTLIENNPLSFGQGLSIVTAAGNQNTYAQQESVQNNTVVLSQTGGIAYGIGIIDTTWLNGTATFANNYLDPTGANYGPYFIGQYNGSGQNPTDGATSSGSNVLHFSSTAQPFWQNDSVSAGELVYDISNPSAIPAGTTVISVGATTVTLSANPTGAGVGNGDIIRFGDGSYSGTVSTFNNINMLTGAAYAQNVNVTSVTQVVASPSTGTETPGNTLTLTVDFSAAVTVTGAPTLTFNDGGTATYVGGSGTNALTFKYTVGAGDSAVPALAITQVNLPNGATIKDGSGAAANLSNALATFSNLAVGAPPGPTLTSIAESPSSGDLNAGKTVTLTLNLSSAVTVAGGTPTLTLNDGGTATYSGGSGSNALTFSYTVGASDANVASLAATAVNLNGATVKDGSGNAASLSLGGISQAGPQIDTNTAISAISEMPSSGILNAGKTVTYTLTMNEVVTVNTAGGSPTLTFNDGGIATYVGGSGTNTLTFSYTVGAGQNTPDLMVSAVNLNGATVIDGAGNAANLSLTNIAQGSPVIDTTPPALSSVAATAGSYNTGKTLTLTLNMSEAVNVTGTPTLTLNDGGTANYTGGSGSGALTFSYTVASGQSTAGLAVTAVNGTITDLAGNALTTAILPANFAGVVIDTTTPSVSSVVASGSGITAGSGDLAAGSVVTLTVNLNEAVTVADGTPTLTLNDGGVATYTGGSGSNALTFKYTVAAGQNTADLAVTAVNLNSASVTDGSGNATNLSGAVTTPNGTLQIDTNAPRVTQVVASPGTGQVTTNHKVLITLNMSEPTTVLGSPTLLLNDGGSATYDATRSTANALVFDYTVGSRQVTTDLKVSGIMLPAGSSIRDLAGNNAVLTGAGADLRLQINTATRGTAGAGSGNLSITNNAELELYGPSKANVTFSSGTGELKLDDSLAFTGRISGLTGADALDLSDVGYGPNTRASFSGNSKGGTLTVTDGSNTAHIALLGNYLSSGWTLSSDGNGGVVVVDPPLSAPVTGSGSNLTAEGDIYSQRVAQFVQSMASTFVTSDITETGTSMAGNLDIAGLSNSFIAQPVQQHSHYA